MSPDRRYRMTVGKPSAPEDVRDGERDRPQTGGSLFSQTPSGTRRSLAWRIRRSYVPHPRVHHRVLRYCMSFTDEERLEMIRYLMNHANEDGGCGCTCLSILDASTPSKYLAVTLKGPLPRLRLP